MQPRACSFFFLLFPHVVLFSFYCPRRANGRPVGAVRLTLPSSALIITIVLCCAVTFRLHTRVLLLHIHICLSVVYNRPFIVLHASSIYPVNYLTLQYYYIIYNRVAISIYLHSTVSTFILRSVNKYNKPLCPFSKPDRYLANECVHEAPLMNGTDERSCERTSEGLILSR